jgi:hypothetical protein
MRLPGFARLCAARVSRVRGSLLQDLRSEVEEFLRAWHAAGNMSDCTAAADGGTAEEPLSPAEQLMSDSLDAHMAYVAQES